MSALNELAQMRRTRGKKRQSLTGRERREERTAFGFLTPWLLGLALITVGPMVASLYLSFTDYNFLQDPQWVGGENYVRLLNDPRFHQALLVTFKYVVISVPVQLAAALLVAIVLDRGLRGLALYRSAFYLPSLLGGSVAIAILWRQIFGAEGLVNWVLGLVGIEGMSWIANPETALGTLIVLNVWTFGAPMIIFLAGLRQIPTMYYEAAAVDGAGRARRFVKITLPLLSPIIFFNLILQLIGAFQAFTQAFIISGGNGSPADSTLFYTLYLYMRGFGNFEMGYASAMAWVLVAIIGLFTLINFVVSKYWVFYDD
ncbi:carbohydrate ABC transporter permease [Ruania zhangjianzhongii]|uniref:carbohydrate ABC transporter permease n=1 Tax=Ruania zhangjianzhongii TaxID=2603206 RepID=UPI0011CCD35B|nr:sugar ABC transporter permease [Ruania zhangjianzhongii]